MDPSMTLGPVFASMADADRSGDVTTAEWQGFLSSVKEKEGVLDRDALKADIVHRALDRDADGKLTGKDIEPIFAEMDRDGDKVISTEELRGRGFGRGQGRGGRGEGQGGDRRRGGGGNRAGGDGGNDDGATTGDSEKSDESKKKAPRKEDLYRQDADQDPDGGQRRGRGRGQDPEGQGRRQARTFDMTAMIARSANSAIVRMADADSNDEVTEAEWKEFVSKFDSKAVVGKLLAPAPRPEGEEGDNDRRGRRGPRSLGDTLDRYFGRDEQEVKTKKQVEDILKGMDRDGDGALKKEEMQPRRLGRAA